MALAIVFAVVALVYVVWALININKTIEKYEFVRTETFYRVTTKDDEDYSDETICPVEYCTEDEINSLVVEYSYEEWDELPESGGTVTGYIYSNQNGDTIAFPNEATEQDIGSLIKDVRADAEGSKFGIALAFGFAALALFIIGIRFEKFTTYEKIWFVSIIVLASVFSIIFPEESANGINGLWIMGLYLLDTFLNILCELLISKQSKWNFIVSLFVEITEIAICVVLAYRFATLASTLFFWIPCDIVSFINWNKHPDEEKEDLTKVRTLKGWHEILILSLIVAWTLGVGYFLTTLDFGGDFIKDPTLEIIICYLDACASAVGIANGVFILLRFREQWIAWYASAILEAVMNILSGQYVLLILKAGYLTNTTYGMIKWSKYIKSHKKDDSVLF